MYSAIVIVLSTAACLVMFAMAWGFARELIDEARGLTPKTSRSHRIIGGVATFLFAGLALAAGVYLSRLLRDLVSYAT
jgi:uncharacterized membrane protein